MPDTMQNGKTKQMKATNPSMNGKNLILMLCLTTICLIMNNFAKAQENQLLNPDFKQGLKGWTNYKGVLDETVSRGPDGKSIRFDFNKDRDKGQKIIYQTVTLNQKDPAPIIYGGASKAQGLPADATTNHSIYGLSLCVVFQDGSKKWPAPGQKFTSGTHDWERIEAVYMPPRPIKEVRLSCRLRNNGTVWFDDLFLKTEPKAQKLKGCSCVETPNLDIILENDFLRLEFEPAKGGTCRSFLVKENQAQFSGSKHHDFRMFTDRLRVKGRFYNEVYKAKIIRNTPECAEFSLTVDNPGGNTYLTIEKTFRLTKHSSALQVTYRYNNLPAAMGDLIIEPYFRNGWNAQHEKTQHYLFPSYHGVKTYNHSGGDCRPTGLVAGWMGAADGKGKTMVCEFDYSRVEYMYMWRGGVDQTTLEWAFSPVSIKAGNSFKTTLSFYPATGMTSIENAENGIVSNVTDTQENIDVTFIASHSYILRGKFEQVSHSGDQTVTTQILNFQPGQKITVPLKRTPNLKLLRYSLYHDGAVVFSAEHPYYKGHIFPPRQKKVKPAEIIPFDLNLSDDLVTPHTNWAKPYAGGNVKALFITDITQLREVIELNQRMDLDYQVIRISRSEPICKYAMMDRYSSFTLQDSNLSLKKKLETTFDVIVISGMLWNHLNADNRKAIARQLDRGTGLVLLSPHAAPKELLPYLNNPSGIRTDNQHFITHATPWDLIAYQPEEIPPFQANLCQIAPAIAVTQQGLSRTVVLSWNSGTGLTPYLNYTRQEPTFRYQDYSLSLLARALIWAAHKDLPATIKDIRAKQQDLCLTLNPNTKHMPLTAKIILYGMNTRKRCETSITLTGEKQQRIPLKTRLEPGENICDVILTSNGKTIDWGSIKVTAPTTATWKTLRLDQKQIAAKENITGNATFNATGTCKLIFELTDGYGRLLDRTQAEKEFNGTFTLTPQEIKTGRLLVTAKLFQNGRLMHVIQTDIMARLDDNVKDIDFPFAIGDQGHRNNSCMRRYLNPLRFQSYRNGGVNIIRFWTTDEEPAYRDHLLFGFPYIFLLSHDQHLWTFTKRFAKPYAETKDRKYLCRKPCLNDPAYLNHLTDRVTKDQKRLEPYSPIYYDLGGENSLTLWEIPFDFCFSKPTLHAFRIWLRQTYGTLENLNREWDAAYQNWNQIMPYLTEEAKKFGTPKRRYAPWADHRRFMEITFCDSFQIIKDTMIKNKADRPLVLSGTQPPNGYTGMDFWRLSKCIGVNMTYRLQGQEEIIRSFQRPLCMPCYGFGLDGPMVAYDVWHDAFRFQNFGIYFQEALNFLYPDYTLPRQVKDLLSYTKDLREGGARLLRQLHQKPEVLIHYSHHSIHAAVIEDNYPDFLAARQLWTDLLQDMHVPYRFIAYAEIQQGKLQDTEAKILILPFSIALSTRETQEIKRFAQRGGLVIADRYAGIMNQHCNILKHGSLNDLFGLGKNDDEPGTNQTIVLGNHKLMATIGAATGPNPQLDSKAGFLNPFEKGAGLYLNLHWPVYSNVRDATEKQETALAYRNWLARQFEAYRNPQTLRIDAPPFSHVQTYLLKQTDRSNQAQYLGLVRDYKASGDNATLTARLNNKAHIYDMRNKRYLGLKDRWSVTLANAEAAFYAAMPYKISGLTCSVSDSLKAGKLATLTATVLKDSRIPFANHVLRLEVLAPDGTPMPLYSQNQCTDTKGTATFTFRTALNDAVGPWKLRVTDFTSGLSKTCFLNLLAP